MVKGLGHDYTIIDFRQSRLGREPMNQIYANSVQFVRLGRKPRAEAVPELSHRCTRIGGCNVF
jgi:hypothetical protein